MALLRNAKGRRDENSGYVRVLGDVQMGQLLSRVQASVITMGTELEKMLWELAPKKVDDLASLLAGVPLPDNSGVYLANKAHVRAATKAGSRDTREFTADFLVIDTNTRHCHVIELKDGDSFDTKKATGELESMMSFSNTVGKAMPYRVTPKFCCFNQEVKERIIAGAKGRFSLDQVMTGSEFCELIGIKKDWILEKRAAEAAQNLEYFVWSILEIPSMRSLLVDKLRQGPATT